MIRGARHMGLPVTNLAASLAFYRDKLGFAVASDEVEEGPFLSTILGFADAKAHIVKLKVPGGHGFLVELLAYEHPRSTKAPGLKINTVGHGHLALTVDDLDAAYRRLASEGVVFISPPAVSPSGRAKVAFCEDPDGYRLELVELMP